MHSLDYDERLKTLHLTDLETRRNRGDLIQTYKILNGLEKVSDECKSNRVVPLWNGLTDAVVRAPNLNSFKARLDNFMSKPRVISGVATAGH